MLLNEIVSSIIQILLFSIVPFVMVADHSEKKGIFLCMDRFEKSKRHFMEKSPCCNKPVYHVSVFTLYLTKDVETATSEFEGLGISALLPAFVYAVFHTSLPEELLFRGFLLKRLSHPFGFRAANIIQGLLFGLLHGAMFLIWRALPGRFLLYLSRAELPLRWDISMRRNRAVLSCRVGLSMQLQICCCCCCDVFIGLEEIFNMIRIVYNNLFYH